MSLVNHAVNAHRDHSANRLITLAPLPSAHTSTGSASSPRATAAGVLLRLMGAHDDQGAVDPMQATW